MASSETSKKGGSEKGMAKGKRASGREAPKRLEAGRRTLVKSTSKGATRVPDEAAVKTKRQKSAVYENAGTRSRYEGDREPIGRMEELLLRHISENRASRRVFKEIESFRSHLELHHKIIYAFLVFFGAVLIWYGMWQVVAMIPYLSNPVLAILLGSLMLAFAGAFFRKVK